LADNAVPAPVIVGYGGNSLFYPCWIDGHYYSNHEKNNAVAGAKLHVKRKLMLQV